MAWLMACVLALALEGRGFAVGTWTPLVRTAPGSIGLMMLLSDGTVMAMNSGTSNACYRLTPDSTGSYVNGTWTTLAPMNSTRLYYSSQVLKDGRVFVAGGEYGTGKTLGETYNPLTNVWTAAPVPGHTFSDSNSEILPDGRVLCALVEGSLKGTILFDPTAGGGVGSWTLGPTCIGIHNESAWVKLPDNSVLFVDRNTRNSERYIPAQNQWIADATVPVDLYDPYGLEKGAGLLLPNGKAFFLGSLGHTAIYTPSGTTAAGTWVAGPDIPSSKGTPDAPAAMMVNGKILCAVSPIPTSGTHFPTPTTFYEYDYSSGAIGAFTSVPTPTGGTLNHASYYGTMLTLPNGTVLYSDFNSRINSYAPDGAPLAAGKPVISSITANGNGSFHLTGTQLNGISQGSSYGDDNQNSTNYPIVRLTSGSTVYYARTFNWSSTAVCTGNTPVTTEFTVPGTVPVGIYPLVVIANGIASDPVSFTNGTLSTNANLSNLAVSVGTLTPGFAGATTDYTVTVPNATASITLTPTLADGTATVKVNGTTVASGNPSGPITLVLGPNPIPVVVTAQDTTTTKTYTVTVTRIANVTYGFNAPTDVPVTAGSFAAAGKAVFFTLNCAPAVGASLTVVNNTGLGFIGGRFENLAQGQAVALTFNGATYNYVANYHGGTVISEPRAIKSPG